MKLPSCSDGISREIEGRAINLKARGGRPVALRRRISGVWCSEWELQGEYRNAASLAIALHQGRGHRPSAF